MRYGLLLAVVVGVPVLWPLVSSGEMTTDAAITRGGIVFAGCVLGVYLLTYLVDSYTQQQKQEQRRAEMTARLEQAVQQREAIQQQRQDVQRKRAANRTDQDQGRSSAES